jgi:hypothetical protein
MALTTQTPPPFEVGTASDQRQRHWLGLPVRSRTEGTFEDILSTLPHFGRQPFAMASLNGDGLGVNSYLDMVYRMPIHQSQKPIPVGVVSKNYRLVDHHHILRTVQHSLANRKLDLGNVRVVAEWTIHGERAHFSIILPPEEHFTVGTLGSWSRNGRSTENELTSLSSCHLKSISPWAHSEVRMRCDSGSKSSTPSTEVVASWRLRDGCGLFVRTV